MNNLETVKKGDKVVSINAHRFGGNYVSGAFIVDHLTKTMVVGTQSNPDVPPTRVRIDTAEEVGTKFSRTHYYPDSHPHVAKVRQAQLDAIAFGALKARVTKAVEQSANQQALLDELAKIIDETLNPVANTNEPARVA